MKTRGEIAMFAYCGGTIKETVTDFVERIDNYVVIVKNVPCEKCGQCGEEYFSTAVSKRLEAILTGIQRISSEITVTVIDYASKVA